MTLDHAASAYKQQTVHGESGEIRALRHCLNGRSHGGKRLPNLRALYRMQIISIRYNREFHQQACKNAQRGAQFSLILREVGDLVLTWFGTWFGPKGVH